MSNIVARSAAGGSGWARPWGRRLGCKLWAGDWEQEGALGVRSKLENEGAIGAIAIHAGQLGTIAAEIAGVVHDLATQSSVQTSTFSKLSDDVAGLGNSNNRIVDSVLSASRQVKEMRRSVDASLDRARALEASVLKTESAVVSIEKALKGVSGAADEISKIALQTRLVAFNASVEAARAGAGGTGFGVIAQAIKDLSEQVHACSQEISGTIQTLAQQVASLETSIEKKALDGAAHLSGGNSVIAEAIDVFGKAFSQVEQQVVAIHAAADDNNGLCSGISLQVRDLASDVSKSSASLDHADRRVESLLVMSEDLIRLTAESGAETEDTAYISNVVEAAAALGRELEAGIARGRFSVEDLFDSQYLPIRGTDPQQFTTRFCEATDRLFPPIQEEMLTSLPGVVFCAAVDRNGYLPTHNRKYSQTQRAGDAAWNAANCRNRRIFDDRTGLAAATNTEPFLLQTYRRDMGNGQFMIMKDLSAPIYVFKRHWGGLRCGYTTAA